MWHRFSGGMRQAAFHALEQADRRGAKDIATADLLLGMARVTDCSAATLLKRLGVTPERLDQQTWAGEEPAEGAGRTLTPDARRAVEQAYALAMEMGDDYIGTEHLLLALVRQRGGAAGRALGQLGLSMDTAARELLRLQKRRVRLPAGVVVPGHRVRQVTGTARALAGRAGQLAFLAARRHAPFVRYVVLRKRTLQNPYPFYRRLRRDPFYFDDLIGSWFVTGHPEVVAILQEPRLTAQQLRMTYGEEALPPLVGQEFNVLNGALARQMLFQDPPHQTRLRSLVSRQFTPRVIEAMRAQIQQVTDGLLDAVENTGRMDVIRDLAFPLPAMVIARMLGVPVGDREQFKKWSDDFIRYIGGESTLAQELEARRSLLELGAYFRQAIAGLRGGSEENLLSLLLAAEEQGDRLSEEELIANCLLILAAGHETTTNLIGNGLLALLRHPQQLAKLRDDPSLAGKAVEELLRYDSPVQWTSRIATEDFEWDGRRIKKGQRVNIGLAAANRDPARFADPDRLDICRPDNRHVAFGHGHHFCLGAALARMEGQVALGALLRRFPRLRLANEALEWQGDFTFRALKSLPAVFDH